MVRIDFKIRYQLQYFKDYYGDYRSVNMFKDIYFLYASNETRNYS